MKNLPPNISPYKRTDVFDETTIPKGLLSNHSTKEGVWGKINIVEGRLLYRIEAEEVEEVELSIDRFGVVEPQVLHSVAPIGRVKFFVEFLK
ncbi:MAG: DUF1971 domain-containing protein [Deltaproteobacteria bacterium]|nr:MAG: DUF1971 domain-containing protein [Deltaproteobacteria bacterium]TNF26202.1 MAG: DUF1971 domain-containing protein [Deltaproteobacteria bacterium]